MATVDPGELRYSITIQLPTRTTDANSHYQSGAPQEIHARAAVRITRSQDAAYEVGAERAQETVQFTIRWRKGIDTSAVVLFKGKRYELEFVDPVPFAGNYMRLRGVSYDAGVGEGV